MLGRLGLGAFVALLAIDAIGCAGSASSVRPDPRFALDEGDLRPAVPENPGSAPSAVLPRRMVAEPLRSLASGDGRLRLTLHRDGTATLRDASDGRVRAWRRIAHDGSGEPFLRWGRDDRRALVGSFADDAGRSSLWLWDLATDSAVNLLDDGNARPPFFVAASPGLEVVYLGLDRADASVVAVFGRDGRRRCEARAGDRSAFDEERIVADDAAAYLPRDERAPAQRIDARDCRVVALEQVEAVLALREGGGRALTRELDGTLALRSPRDGRWLGPAVESSPERSAAAITGEPSHTRGDTASAPEPVDLPDDVARAAPLPSTSSLSIAPRHVLALHARSAVLVVGDEAAVVWTPGGPRILDCGAGGEPTSDRDGRAFVFSARGICDVASGIARVAGVNAHSDDGRFAIVEAEPTRRPRVSLLDVARGRVIATFEGEVSADPELGDSARFTSDGRFVLIPLARGRFALHETTRGRRRGLVDAGFTRLVGRSSDGRAFLFEATADDGSTQLLRLRPERPRVLEPSLAEGEVDAERLPARPTLPPPAPMPASPGELTLTIADDAVRMTGPDCDATLRMVRGSPDGGVIAFATDATGAAMVGPSDLAALHRRAAGDARTAELVDLQSSASVADALGRCLEPRSPEAPR